MKLPSRDYNLPADLVCPVREIERRTWQAHLAKHPLGVRSIALSGNREAWNGEGWDALAPPVITAEQRARLVAAIATFVDGRVRCGVPELCGRNRGSNLEDLGCYRCEPPVLVRCEQACNGPDGPGARYAAVTEQLLDALGANAVIIARSALTRALLGIYTQPSRLDGLVVLSFGLDRKGAKSVARISRHDGVRAEFYLDPGKRLTWRTTYRNPISLPAQRLSFLTEMARSPLRANALSDQCMVPRPWWDANAR